MLPPGMNIRHCTPRDEAGVYHVCLCTGDSGKDASQLYADPQALGHIYVGPYMALEPAYAFVLEDSAGVCGYVLGALDSHRFYDCFQRLWLPAFRARHIEPTGDPGHWTPDEQIYALFYHPEVFCPEPYEAYPSHLHIDLLPRVQGRGIGNDMMAVILRALTEAGSPGVHLVMSSSNARAEHFYKKLGFQELARRSANLYLGKRFM